MEPITETVTVTCTCGEAFAAFTDRIDEWWPPAYSPDPDTLDTVVLEPHVGGRVYLRMSDGAEHAIGEVTSWSPGEIYGQSWVLAQDPAQPSSITVTFTPTGEGTEVTLRHDGWHDGNAAFREKFGDWALILEQYAEAAQA
ncbi:SRPBCC domain-containing protein [Nocardioides mesophilus]|uniref:SRPBCC domain-containing protein n=1 Tax=Nocardioides mesophilus TaxID=433659 RepID=A0A7G9R7D9_9ACTN|nr:SRPBCC domain-containing protein [Nocardioides mesophilus]QNN51514.1 SRPBCC domain-containing protein [Nocardioides mesophilus]